MAAPVWQSFNITPQFELPIDSTDDEVDTFIRSNAFGGTSFSFFQPTPPHSSLFLVLNCVLIPSLKGAHGVSTARMGKANTAFGEDVVGPDFKVKGVKGLRIVDASVIPFMPNGHSMAPVYVVAERAGDIIRGRA